MNQRPIALQLYSVREYLARDFEAAIRRVAGIGYAGVETWRLPEGVSPIQAATLFNELGLTVCAAHAPLPLGENAARTLDEMAALGSDRLVCASLPPEEYADRDAAVRACDKLNEAAGVCAANGLRFGVHNHWWEFERIGGDGPRPYELWLRHLDPPIFFELDVYWAQVAGVDPLDAIRQFGDRLELLHLKDGPADGTQSEMTAIGRGALDYEAIIPAAKNAEWLIVDLDHSATDMMTTLEQSYTYLTEKGLGHGR